MYLTAYDIHDNKRRRKVAKIVNAYALGGQKSALELKLKPALLRHMASKLESRIDIESDRIHIFDVTDNPVLLGTARACVFDEGMVII